MFDEDSCPHCKADLRTQKIPEKDKVHFGNKEYFSSLIGIEDESYDGISFWCCPKCWVVWDRFSGQINTSMKEKKWFREMKDNETKR